MVTAQTIAQAVTSAQQLATAEERCYLVTRGTAQDGPLVEPLAGLERLGVTLLDLIGAGRVLLVSPVGMHRGMTAAEILTESATR